MDFKLENICNKYKSKYIPFSIPCASSKDLKTDINENMGIAEEQHHAMHVLLFFQILAYRTLDGQKIKRSILGRIIHHLMDLREFLEDGSLNDQVNILLASVQKEYDNSLPYIVSRFHSGIRVAARALDYSKRHQFISTVNNFLINCSEHEQNPKICMYPWLVANQNKVLEYADHYGKREVFRKLLPISRFFNKNGAHTHI